MKKKKQGRWNRFVLVFNEYWKIFVGITVGIPFIYFVYVEFIKSEKKKSDEKTTISGFLRPPELPRVSRSRPTKGSENEEFVFLADPPNYTLDQSSRALPPVRGILIPDFEQQPKIVVKLGRVVLGFPTEFLYRGPDLFSISFSCHDGYFIIGAKDNRVYVSTEFRRLQGDEEIMGIIEFNHWRLFNGTYLDYPLSNDSMFEVRDKQNKIAFSLKYAVEEQTPTLYVSGYFIGDAIVTVINTNLQDTSSNVFQCYRKSAPYWKDSVSVRAGRIKSIFSSP